MESGKAGIDFFKTINVIKYWHCLSLTFMGMGMNARVNPIGIWIVVFATVGLLALLAQLAVRESAPPVFVRDLLMKQREYRHQEVVLEGYVRNSYPNENASLSSFDFSSENYTIPVRSGTKAIPPKFSRVILRGIYRPQRTHPFVSDHIELIRIEPLPSRWWFDELDYRARYGR